MRNCRDTINSICFTCKAIINGDYGLSNEAKAKLY